MGRFDSENWLVVRAEIGQEVVSSIEPYYRHMFPTQHWLPKLLVAACWAAILYCVVSYISGFYVTGEMIMSVFGSLQAAFMLQSLDVVMPMIGLVLGLSGAVLGAKDRQLSLVGRIGAAVCILLVFVYLGILVFVVKSFD